MSQERASATGVYRILARCRVGRVEVAAIGNLRRRGDAWKILHDRRLRVTCRGREFSEIWLIEHWDAVADALIAAADEFVVSRDWFAVGRPRRGGS